MQHTLKPNVTFTSHQILCIEIKGEGNGYILNDGGLVRDFLQFIVDNKIWSSVRAGNSGGGRYLGFFYVEDAERIETWLKEHGAMEVEEHTNVKGRNTM